MRKLPGEKLGEQSAQGPADHGAGLRHHLCKQLGTLLQAVIPLHGMAVTMSRQIHAPHPEPSSHAPGNVVPHLRTRTPSVQQYEVRAMTGF